VDLREGDTNHGTTTTLDTPLGRHTGVEKKTQADYTLRGFISLP